jgi:hypothetical protein
VDNVINESCLYVTTAGDILEWEKLPLKEYKVSLEKNIT